MLRSFGKVFKGYRFNGGISLLETQKPEEELELRKNFCQRKFSKDKESPEAAETKWYHNCENQGSERAKSEGPSDKDDVPPFKEAFSLRNALGWGSVAAISLNACQLFESRKNCGGPTKSCPRKVPIGSLVARTVLAQPITQPALKPIASKFYASTTSDSDDVHFSDGSDTTDSEEGSASDLFANSRVSRDNSSRKSSRRSKSKIDLNKQIEEEFQALKEVEEELLREMDTSRVAAHAHALNQRIGLTTGHGPFAVRDPFEDPERNAFLCFRESSRLGSASAIYNLAVCYERGIGTQQDLKMGKVPGCDSEAGVALIREAAKAGLEEAWTALLEMLETKSSRKTSVSDCYDDLTKGLDVMFKTSTKIPPIGQPRRAVSVPRNLDLIDTGYDSSGLKLSPVLPLDKSPLLVEPKCHPAVNV